MNEEHNNTNLRETLKLPRLNTQSNSNESDLPELKRQLVKRYQRKIKRLENTTVFDVNNLTRLSFSENLDEFIESYDLSSKYLKDRTSNLDKTVLIKLPTLNKKREKYIEIERWACYLIIIFAAIGMAIIALNIKDSVLSYRQTDEVTDDIRSFVDTDNANEEIEDPTINPVEQEQSFDNSTTTTTTPPATPVKPKTYSYNVSDFDFKSMKNSKNSDIVGWMTVDYTSIDYPIVQTDNNDFYLNHSLNKKENAAGWIFVDSRNTIDDWDKNTIIYGHNMKNGSMFGTLKRIITSKTDAPIYIYTPKHKYKWKIISVYNIPETTDYLESSFATDDDFASFVKMIVGRSRFNYNTEVAYEDYLLTLSTCYTHYTRTVVHAKLVSIE